MTSSFLSDHILRRVPFSPIVVSNVSWCLVFPSLYYESQSSIRTRFIRVIPTDIKQKRETQESCAPTSFFKDTLTIMQSRPTSMRKVYYPAERGGCSDRKVRRRHVYLATLFTTTSTTALPDSVLERFIVSFFRTSKLEHSQIQRTRVVPFPVLFRAFSKVSRN